MQTNVTGLKLVLLGAAIAIGSAAGGFDAQAKTPRASSHTTSHAVMSRTSAAQPGLKRVRIGGYGRKSAYLPAVRYAAEPDASYGGGYLQCVPFARANSGIELAGNAAVWWGAAQGVYERGSRPEVGSVLNFRSNGRMHSGHVAVVTNVDNARTVEIDHANWGGPGGARGGVSRNVTVVDVSPMNDWSAVRVSLGRGSEFGSVYPTFGFIYDRPDRGTMVANNGTAPMPLIANAPPRDLRPSYERIDVAAGDEPVEVAEATVRGSYRHGRSHAGRQTLVHQTLVHRAKAGAYSAQPAQRVRKHTRG